MIFQQNGGRERHARKEHSRPRNGLHETAMEVSGSGMKEARRKWEKSLSEVARDRSQRALCVLLAFALCQMRDFGGSEQRRGMF